MKKGFLGLLLAGLLVLTIASQSVYAQMEPDEGFMSPGQDEPGMPPMGPGFRQPGQHPGGGPNKMGHHKGMMGAFKELNLTQEQKEKLKSQRTSTQSQMKNLKEQLMNERQKLMTLMFDANSSKSAMYAQQEKVSSIQNQLTRLRLDNIASFKEILTPEQKQKMQQIGSEKLKKMQEMKSKMAERKKGSKGNRKPPQDKQ